MEYEQLLRFGGHTVTLLHPLVVAFLALAAGLVLGLPRRYVLVPMIAAMVLIPTGQRLVLPGLNLTVYRLLLACAWVRLVMRDEHRSLELNRTDRAVLWWVTAAVVTFTILWANTGAIVNRLGFAYDVLGTYFLVRMVVDDEKGIERIIKTLVASAVLVAILMVIEARIDRNPFAELGGVPAVPAMREGHIRAQGPFNHAILAGTFGATLLPLAMVFWWRRRRGLAVVGGLAAVTITWAAGSSGPLLTLLAGCGGLMAWPLREHMAWVRRTAVFLMLALHMIMKDPVWALVGRGNLFAGSTGYHRFYLIDNFIRRFDEWFLLGVRFTSGWGFLLLDQTNQYVSVGASGGLVTLVLFILVIKRSFASLHRARHLVLDDPGRRRAMWALSSMLFAHAVAFIGVSYFGQMADLWILSLGLISAASSIAVKQADALQKPTLQREHINA